MKNDGMLPNIRVPTADLAMYRRQAEAAGLSLAEWVRAALDRAAAAPAARLEDAFRPTFDSLVASVDERPAVDRVAALAALPGLRRGADLASPTPERRPTAAERQQIVASAAHAYRAGTEPAVIVARLVAGFPDIETYIRATVERMDGAA